MSELIVIGDDTPEEAEEARADHHGMAKEYLVAVEDAVVAIDARRSRRGRRL